MVDSDPLLKNQYSVTAVSTAKYSSVRYCEAMDFIAFVTSPEGQKIMAAYVKHGVNSRNSRVGGNEEKTIVCS